MSVLGLAGWIVICLVPAAIGGFVSSPGSWYAGLRKPDWNPPSWVFGPVWTFLYLSMAVAAWRVWRRGGWNVQRKPLVIFLVQLALNALWSPLFFGWKQPALAFADIVLLWVSIMGTILAFRNVDKVATVLLVPYLLWVSFAAVLNFAIVRLN